jgi:hypothetical protein
LEPYTVYENVTKTKYKSIVHVYLDEKLIYERSIEKLDTKPDYPRVNVEVKYNESNIITKTLRSKKNISLSLGGEKSFEKLIMFDDLMNGINGTINKDKNDFSFLYFDGRVRHPYILNEISHNGIKFKLAIPVLKIDLLQSAALDPELAKILLENSPDSLAINNSQKINKDHDSNSINNYCKKKARTFIFNSIIDNNNIFLCETVLLPLIKETSDIDLIVDILKTLYVVSENNFKLNEKSSIDNFNFSDLVNYFRKGKIDHYDLKVFLAIYDQIEKFDFTTFNEVFIRIMSSKRMIEEYVFEYLSNYFPKKEFTLHLLKELIQNIDIYNEKFNLSDIDSIYLEKLYNSLEVHFVGE